MPSVAPLRTNPRSAGRTYVHQPIGLDPRPSSSARAHPSSSSAVDQNYSPGW
ncbi:hypothetical protein PGT21_029838 [Puccinia graminis f. sp. tritici]|uniref:Uncharacterized protein n=1 Tax=Puccinia graminis f. sp. tritici TaxID=56615 RepID=A0A5B0QJL5_PUCGR|nr:hypothetical protein PGT21_029838 [Puccinia graminis f. sp. tritici]